MVIMLITLHRASGKSEHRIHILSGSNETCIMCQQNYPLTPFIESSLVKRKPCNLFLDKAEGFAQHCQELEEGWHGKFSSPFPVTVLVAEKGLIFPDLKYNTVLRT